jgi:EAL domain-containing protein (putative c-di-GMP-specific phosphodiesterase class I)
MGADTREQAVESGFGLSKLLRESLDLRQDTTASFLQELLQAARLQLRMEVGFISKFSEGRRVLHYVDQDSSVDLLKVGHADPLDQTYCKKVVDGRLPELIRDAKEEPAARDLAVTDNWGIRAYTSVPLRLADGSVYGTFCTFSFHADHTLNERDMALLRVFGRMASELIGRDVERAREEAALKADVERLLRRDGLHPLWQPIVEIATGRIIGVEALSRFGGDRARSPAEYFGDAARVGMARELETRAMEKGVEVLPELPAGVYVTLNVSANALLTGGRPAFMDHLPLDRLVLEITEHDVVEDYAALAEVLEPLRARGVRLAVDDAGAGYASFRHILRLRPEIIKLDMSLTRDIDSDPTRRSLAASLVQFAREIDCQLVAEGVETRAELETLAALGVQKAQGFYLHRPMPRERLRALVKGEV